MKSRWFASALACLTLVAMPGMLGAAHATTLATQDKAYRTVPSGTIEFSPSVSYSHWNMKREGYGNVDTFTKLEITPTIGYCVSDHYEVTGGFMTRHESSNGMSETALGTTAGLTYNFNPQGGFIPFASVGFGALFYDGFHLDNTAVLAPMVTAGVRVLVGSSASVNASLGFQHEANAQGEQGLSSNRLVAGVGVSL
ncbi:MAG TPA: hypothetical protein VFD83_04505, partial [Candidatus Polarisedimenticolia bacterium]|nr:hypothetical protein [Candidatus Polarisedimenticolia bacterium]